MVLENTSVEKLVKCWDNDNKVIFATYDTFRAAVEQLEEWSRIELMLVLSKSSTGSTPHL